MTGNHCAASLVHHRRPGTISPAVRWTGMPGRRRRSGKAVHGVISTPPNVFSKQPPARPVNGASLSGRRSRYARFVDPHAIPTVSRRSRALAFLRARSMAVANQMVGSALTESTGREMGRKRRVNSVDGELLGMMSLWMVKLESWLLLWFYNSSKNILSLLWWILMISFRRCLWIGPGLSDGRRKLDAAEKNVLREEDDVVYEISWVRNIK